MLRRFLKTDIAEIRIFSRDEKKQDDMRHHYRSDKLRFYIGDVRNPDSLRDAMEGVDYVFHAAALKQVPSCEFYPMEAVRTNVIGTDNVLTAALAAGVKNVVVLSTDKAAYPINAMGMSKALMEKVDDRPLACRRREGNRVLRHALRQCHGLARLGHPAVRRPDPRRPAADRDRPGDDPVHDVARRRGGPGRLRLSSTASRATSSCRRRRPRPSARWLSHVDGCSARPTPFRSSARGTARSSTRRC